MTCLDNSLLQWLSKCDVWINSTSITCELVRNANFRSHPRPTELKKKKKWGSRGWSWRRGRFFLCITGSLGGTVVKRHKRLEFNPWVRKTPWRRKRQPTPVFLSGKFHWTEEPGRLKIWKCHKDLEMTKWLRTQSLKTTLMFNCILIPNNIFPSSKTTNLPC